MSVSQPFTIDIPQSDLDDLRDRLARTRWPADPGNPGGRYGAPRAYIEKLLSYWRDTYDWRVAEAQMNAYNHQRVDIDGIPIHFMWVPGQGPNPTPLILTHGWPWTFWDFHKVAGPLADPSRTGATRPMPLTSSCHHCRDMASQCPCRPPASTFRALPSCG